jgi:hypothetical protein
VVCGGDFEGGESVVGRVRRKMVDVWGVRWRGKMEQAVLIQSV